jgi:tetratricopeptide (TPR) repeat protein/transcriptional regulator with XRE-family HTH domain
MSPPKPQSPTGTRPERNDRLRRARQDRNWTQADVAKAVGTSSITISRWELGVQQPVPYFREKLCALFAMRLEDLGLAPDHDDGPVPRELPRPAADFTGRDAELATLRTLLDGPRSDEARPVVISAIDGMGGVGKSALAIHAAKHLVDTGRFPDGQLYVDLQGSTGGQPPLDPVDALGRLLRSLGLSPAAVPTDVAEAASRFRSLAAERRLLVVLDNAHSAAQVRPLLPGSPTCGVIVTSRQPLTMLEGAHALHLDVLPTDQALALLGQVVGRERVAAEPEAAAEVVRWCGGLPLAIRLAGARLAARPRWPVRELAEHLGDASRRLAELRAGETAVRASFEVSLHALEHGRDPVDRDAAEAFGLLSLADGPDLGVPVAARLLDRPDGTAEMWLERLVDAQLLETPRPGRYRFHDLVRLYAREHAGAHHAEAEQRAALTRGAGFYAATTWRTLALLRPGDRRLANADPRWTGGLDFADAPAALRWLETERANLLAVIAQAAAGDTAIAPELPGQLAQALFGFCYARGYWHEWAQVNEAALELARRAGDRAGQASAHNDLCVAYERLGRFSASVAAGREGLAVFRELGDRRGLAGALNNLSIVYERLGRYEELIACQQESVVIFRELGDRRGLAGSLNNLGIEYGRQDRHEEAVTSLRESLAISRELGDRLSEAGSLHSLGAVLGRLGRAEEALGCLLEGLAICRQLGSRQGEAHTLSDVGVVYRGLGRHEQAVARLRESLAIFRELGARRDQAVVLRELGDALGAAGLPEQARVALKEGLAISEALQIPEQGEIRERLDRLEAAPR